MFILKVKQLLYSCFVVIICIVYNTIKLICAEVLLQALALSSIQTLHTNSQRMLMMPFWLLHDVLQWHLDRMVVLIHKCEEMSCWYKYQSSAEKSGMDFFSGKQMCVLGQVDLNVRLPRTLIEAESRHGYRQLGNALH